MIPEKESHGNLARNLSDGVYSGMMTSRDKVEEIWSQLEYYTLIPETMNDFLKSKGITSKSKRAKVSKELTAYIQQARNFYTYARNSDYRSAALLYYYSFLNLAKAKIVIERPDFAGKKFSHGMDRKIKTGSLGRRTLGVKKTNTAQSNIQVFNELYNLRYQSYLPVNKSLNIRDLLGYCSDISSEYTKVFGLRAKYSGVKYFNMMNNLTRKSWVLLAIYDAGKFRQFNKAFRPFFNEFDQTQISTNTRNATFKISGFDVPWYGFYQSRVEFDYIGTDGIDTWSPDAQLKQLIGEYSQYSVYGGSDGFEILEPLNRIRQIPMDEMLSIYAIMFYISEIVRYDPESLNHFLSDKTKDGWLLKSFIESTSLTFLIRMSSWITGNDYIVNSR